MRSRGIVGAAALLSLAGGVAAAGKAPTGVIGFNYGNMKDGQVPKTKDDYLTDFNNAKKLAGAENKFTSARLYTMIQAGTDTDPNEAIDAAIETDTSLLLGMWASAGADTFKKEISALKNSIEKYGDKLTKLVVGLSVGSEDLYRNSVVGIKNKSPVGANPSDVIDYIKQVREVLKDSPLADVLVGHVDTGDTWVNESNSEVIDNVDWLGFDGYPYFELERENAIENNPSLFFQGYNKTAKAAKGKPVWITETGFPVSGKTQNKAVPGTKDAETYYGQVGCRVFGQINTWWYILEEDGASPNFGVSEKGSTKPFYNLDCAKVNIDYSAGSSADDTSSNSTSSSSDGSSSSGSSTSSGAKPSGSDSGKSSGASSVKSFSISAFLLAAGVAAFLV